MSIEIIPATVNDDKGFHLLFEHLREKQHLKWRTINQFRHYKNLESSIEPTWEFVVIYNNRSLGTLTLIKRNIQPASFYFLSINIEEQLFTKKIQLKIREWLVLKQYEFGFRTLVAYSSQEHIANFIIDLGGEVVNWLYFFELNFEDLDLDLLNGWDNSSLLIQNQLELQFCDKIPDDLMAAHAKLHTILSNDIKRKDYSWRIVKTVDYTRKRQEVLFAQGKKVQLVYLLDKEKNIIGLSKVVIDPANPETASQTISGVRREFRGLGLAKLLKSSMIKRILNRYPQIKYIETDCLEGNVPMQLINEKMGFRRKRNKIEKEFILERLFLSAN